MGDNAVPPPAQRALYATQQEARRDIFQLIRELRDYSSISFFIQVDGVIEWSSSLDIVVRMLGLLISDTRIPRGRLNWTFDANRVAPTHINEAKRLLAECITAIKSCGVKFVVMSHVDGQPNIELVSGGQSWEEAVISMARKAGGLVADLTWAIEEEM